MQIHAPTRDQSKSKDLTPFSTKYPGCDSGFHQIILAFWLYPKNKGRKRSILLFSDTFWTQVPSLPIFKLQYCSSQFSGSHAFLYLRITCGTFKTPGISRSHNIPITLECLAAEGGSQ